MIRNYYGNITLSIIKPDAIKNGYTLPILIMIFKAGFNIKSIKTMKISKRLAIKFYNEHKNKYFFNNLIDFITSGPILSMILNKKNAVEDFRKLIGNTNPVVAKKGTIRNLYATSLKMNAIHGSDSNDSAIKESLFLFSDSSVLL
ncbi:nucleoside-diphosphate kinase [Blattabacterium cuenoti]|uniref:nucleoside-diphosphate kinase n=1 Tax=Blattabacterium cuenoti TaxID=1653831 RepID=UPI00163BD3A5|nr:nucleoside-diphosphate kinase [Blattabacterium cuenoti]